MSDSSPGSSPSVFDGIEPTGSIIYMLRTTQQHHVQLSAMADQKASFLIASSFIMLTVLFRQIYAEGLSISLLVLSFFTFTASMFAVFAVMPRNKMPDFDWRNCNPLFFGCFAQMTEDQYLSRMRDAMETDQKVYETMSTDIYYLGKMLYEKKYKYLSYSYTIFMGGLLSAIVVAILEYSVFAI